MTSDRPHDALKHVVAGCVTARVVDTLQVDDVDVCDDEQAGRPACAIDLVVEVGQSRAARARSCEDVGLGDRELP